MIFRDSTLREGADVPGLTFTPARQKALARALAGLGVRELELGAPRRLHETAALAGKLPLKTSGLMFAWQPEHEAARRFGRVDVLMPAAGRGPESLADKERVLSAALKDARKAGLRDVGAGFPHATSRRPEEVRRLARAAARAGASRAVLYDTNGRARPEQVRALVEAVKDELPVHVHCHNDLGLAVANTLAAAEAGARWADVTMLGLGDRAGNCPLEPLAVLLKGRHHLRLERLKAVSDLVDGWTGLRSPLHPVTGLYAFHHSTFTHLEQPALFEAFDPALVGARRRVTRRSVRAFKPGMPTRAQREAVIAAAKAAPSSLGARPWVFKWVADRRVIAEVARIKNARAPKEKALYRSDFINQAPLLLVIAIRMSQAHGRDVETAALAAGNAMNAAASLGLGTTFLCAYRREDPKLERLLARTLSLPAGVAPRVLLPVGRPA